MRQPRRQFRRPLKQHERYSEAASESWDPVAGWYDTLVGDEGTEFHRQVVVPGVLRLLQLAPKEHILDLACGQGAVCKLLHQAGAQVTGVDLSSRLVEMARRRSPKEIRFLVGDARRLDSLADASFDGIVSILALQNIDPLDPVFSECARLLRLDGRAVFVITHPAFRMPRHSRWRFDEEQKTLLRESDAYLTAMQIPIDMRPFKRPGHRMTTTYHRPIEMYVTGLARAGLWVNALEEWPSHKSSQPGPRARAENRARSEFPLFLALRVVRVTSRVRG